MRFGWLILIFLFFCFYSCQNNSGEKQVVAENNNQLLPSSTGGEYEVAVVGSGVTLNTNFKIHLDSLLGEAIPALPQPEALFRPNYLEPDQFQSLFKRNMKIIFVVNPNKEDAVFSYLNKNMPGWQELVKNPNTFKIVQNAWARPQVICILFTDNLNNAVELAYQNKDFILESFRENTKEGLRQILYQKSPRMKIIKRTKENHHLSIDVPKYFDLIMESYPGYADSIIEKYGLQGFIWFRADTKKSNNNIMIYYVDYNEKLLTDINSMFALKQRADRIVGSENKAAYMSIDTIHYDYYIKNVRLKYVNAIELRGMWQMEHDWLGGPYINYFIPDAKNNRIVVIDAFIYAPESEKKPFISRLETILETFKIY